MKWRKKEFWSSKNDKKYRCMHGYSCVNINLNSIDDDDDDDDDDDCMIVWGYEVGVDKLNWK